jgi:hypothetical protein
VPRSNAKENGYSTETNAVLATPPTIHLVLQGKGGIGKSVVASWLAEFLIKRANRSAVSMAIPSTGPLHSSMHSRYRSWN